MTVQDVDNAFRKKAESNVKLYVIRKKIENGTATMEDMSEYSNILCKLLGKTLGENISGVPESERAKFCEWLLRNQYEDTNERLATVQRFLDKKQNIHIAAKKPKFPAERVRKAAHSLEDKTVSEEVIQRRAENAVANIANSFHDDYIKENAEFRQNAGLKCHVTRIGAFNCCAWCAEVAGRYEVGREPADFWRRHDSCSCRMDYENQKVHQRLSGTGKGWKVDSEVQRRQVQRIEYKPKRFSKDEAKALESEKLSRIKGLTIAGKTGIIDARDENSRYKPVSDDAIKNMPILSLFGTNEMNRAYQKANQDLLREVARHPNLVAGTEFSIVYDANMNRIPGYDYVIGRVGGVKVQDPGEPFHAFHNHPSGETFSYTDLFNFSRNKNMLSFTATGNTENLYNILKTENSDIDGYKEFLIQKANEIFYVTNDLHSGQKIEVSYEILANEQQREEIRSKLSLEQKKELQKALDNWSLSCAEGGEEYEIKYTNCKTKLVD